MSAKPSVRSSKIIIIIIIILLPSIQFTTWCIIHVNKKHRDPENCFLKWSFVDTADTALFISQTSKIIVYI